MEEKKTCCICGIEFAGWGNNPEPVRHDGECCDQCNMLYVIPARLEELKHNNNKTNDNENENI